MASDKTTIGALIDSLLASGQIGGITAAQHRQISDVLNDSGINTEETALQSLLSSLNFAAGKRILYDGVAIEPSESGLTQVTATPDISGSITLGSQDDVGWRENNGDVNLSGVLVVSSVSSPTGTYITISPMPFSTGSTTSDRSVAIVTFLDTSAASGRVVLPATITQSSNELIVEMDPSMVEAGDQFQISLNFGTGV